MHPAPYHTRRISHRLPPTQEDSVPFFPSSLYQFASRNVGFDVRTALEIVLYFLSVSGTWFRGLKRSHKRDSPHNWWNREVLTPHFPQIYVSGVQPQLRTSRHKGSNDSHCSVCKFGSLEWCRFCAVRRYEGLVFWCSARGDSCGQMLIFIGDTKLNAWVDTIPLRSTNRYIRSHDSQSPLYPYVTSRIKYIQIPPGYHRTYLNRGPSFSSPPADCALMSTLPVETGRATGPNFASRTLFSQRSSERRASASKPLNSMKAAHTHIPTR